MASKRLRDDSTWPKTNLKTIRTEWISCPVCESQFSSGLITTHIDLCLLKQERREQDPGREGASKRVLLEKCHKSRLEKGPVDGLFMIREFLSGDSSSAICVL